MSREDFLDIFLILIIPCYVISLAGKFEISQSLGSRELLQYDIPSMRTSNYHMPYLFMTPDKERIICKSACDISKHTPRNYLRSYVNI